MSRLRVVMFSLLACAAMWSCTGLQPIAGGTSETTNGFTAVVRDQNGCSLPHALVRVRPENYLSDTGSAGVPYSRSSVIDTFTGPNGRFVVTGIDTGKYAIEVQDGMGRGALLRKTALKDSIVDCGVAVVRPVGSIRGFVDRRVVAESVTVYVLVYGLERLVRADPVTGIFTVRGLPPENYTLHLITSSSLYAKKELPALVISGGSTDIGRVVLFPFNGWTYSTDIVLNTSATGANDTGNVLNFPVLVRLNAGNFSFSQAKTNGEDVRFAKSDTTPLYYEIEQWDSASGAAELWVKVDTVLGNNSSQFIKMYWGNPAAASASNSAAVFDTANGFQGVWHLSEAGNTTAYDATINHYNGTPYNMTAASSVPGAIGSARKFNGTSQYITMLNTASSKLNLPQNGAYSLSLWAYADTIDANWHEVAGKGHEQYYLKLKCFGNNRATWEFVEFQDQQGWQFTEDSVPPAPGSGTWVNIAGVHNGTQQFLYIDGMVVNSSTPLMTGNYARNTGDNFMIGRYARIVTIPSYEGWCYFLGKVDEVRVSSGAPSPDWIKLCYMNQRADDKLVIFK
jgi:hypothetical protein